MKTMINMAADRAAFIDQSQSFNIFVGEPNFAKLTAIHFYGWKKVSEVNTRFWCLFVQLNSISHFDFNYFGAY